MVSRAVVALWLILAAASASAQQFIGGFSKTPSFTTLAIGTPPVASPYGLAVVPGAYFGTAYPPSASWLELQIPNTVKFSQLASLSTIGQGFGLLGGVRTSDHVGGGFVDVFGVGGFAVCDATGGATNGCWGVYSEVRRTAASTDQFHQGIESDMINFGSVVVNGPYTIAPNGNTPNLWLSCGRPDVTAPTSCTSAVNIINNGANYQNGIVFQSTSVQANGGVSNAMLLPKSYAISWQEPATKTQVAQIRSDVTVAGNGGNIIFGNGAIYFQGHDATIGLQLSDLASAADYVTIYPATSGNSSGITTNAGNLTIGSNGGTGGILLQGVSTGTNADFLCLSAGGQILLQTSACTISSMRFKNLIGGYGESSLGVIGGLKPIVFTMKGENADRNYSRPQIGLSAENVAAVEPRCAIYEDDGVTPKSYRQECLIAVLAGAIQEQQRELEALRAHQ